MEIVDRKSEAIHFFFTGMDEMLNCISEALKNRTPHLNGEKFLTGKDVCRMLHISVRTLQEWRRQEKIPYIRLKGKILYRESEIIRCVGSNYLQTIE
jgi:hypothetical protein